MKEFMNIQMIMTMMQWNIKIKKKISINEFSIKILNNKNIIK
jgi:hypothetical protein